MSDSDDRKRIFTEGGGGGSDGAGGHINSMLIGAKAAKSSNVMDGLTDDGPPPLGTRHSAC